uniref:Neprosin PEP catalytic domain-containing protein n=1 Tax=Oryza brachyantha TaxID=4533 RepID=J3NDI7_ORYBR
MATFDVHGFPGLNKNQISSAEIWVVNEHRRDLTDRNFLLAGWMVHPYVHGDSKTHFYTMWTVDNGIKTGCYNLDCDGFVPVNNAPITPGDVLEPTNGTLSVTIKIFKKKDDGDCGYTQSVVGTPSPPMGNGQWPGKNSASFRDIKFVDANGQGYDPAPWPIGLVGMSTNTKCYQVSPYLDGIFHYGGPGGCTTISSESDDEVYHFEPDKTMPEQTQIQSGSHDTEMPSLGSAPQQAEDGVIPMEVEVNHELVPTAQVGVSDTQSSMGSFVALREIFATIHPILNNTEKHQQEEEATKLAEEHRLDYKHQQQQEEERRRSASQSHVELCNQSKKIQRNLLQTQVEGHDVFKTPQQNVQVAADLLGDVIQ